MYKYFYKINEPTSGKNENELQITCHRALARSIGRNSSCVRALLSDCQMPSNRWQRFNLIPVCIEPLLHLTHAHTRARAQYISTDDFFPHSVYFTFAHNWFAFHTPSICRKMKISQWEQKKKRRLEQNDEKWCEEVGKGRSFTPQNKCNNIVVAQKKSRTKRIGMVQRSAEIMQQNSLPFSLYLL